VDTQNGHKLIQQEGAWQGVTCAITRYVDDHLTVVVLTNLSDVRPRNIAPEIAAR
jgi:hypothetical protein